MIIEYIVSGIMISLIVCCAKDYLIELFCKYKDKKNKEVKQLADDLSKHIGKNLPYETEEDMSKVIYNYFNRK